MKQKVITDGAGETITIKYDGERFAILQKKISSPYHQTTILSHREMEEIIAFAQEELKNVRP